VTVAYQACLFDSGPEIDIAPGPLPGAVERIPLAFGAWIDLSRGWMRGAAPLFEHLVRQVPWHAERRVMYERVVDVPRLLSFYDHDALLPHPALNAAKQALDDYYGEELGEPFCTAGLCYYRDGRDSVAWHGDRIGRGADTDTMVAIISVGEPRALLLRPKDGGAATLRYELGHGDLIVMGGSCQRTWDHAVPKTARPAGPRISIQFRPAGVR
jgi:alkylated DNA repair dioxygenase AlkB